jgi:hypothetical protein
MDETPVQGKTYSLFGDDPAVDEYYRRIAALADRCLERWPDARELVTALCDASGRRRRLRRLRERPVDLSAASFVLHAARETLGRYTPDVAAHLRGLRWRERWDRRLVTSEEQYHLYMLEIELCNRLFADEFRHSARKLAFLPHCLRDLDMECKASAKDGDVDLVCRSCSKKCGIHAASRVLRHHRVEPYVWMGAPLQRLLRRLHEAPGGLGVLGIACVPELTFGMRMCRKAGVPVVGVPLNANRCARWMGEFRETSFHLAALERLLA